MPRPLTPETPRKPARHDRPRVSDPGPDPRDHDRHPPGRASLPRNAYDPPFSSGSPAPPRPQQPLLHRVESMNLQALESSDGTLLGLDIVNSASSGRTANVYAPLPVPGVDGLVFSANSAENAHAAIEHLRATSDSGRFRFGPPANNNLVGIVMTPPVRRRGASDVIARDIDWNRLVSRGGDEAREEINEEDGGFRVSELADIVPDIPAPPKDMEL
ncbi:hypothetical protein FZEAL_5838 [Fusarium zealandicum]|uniref:Uncharacterized protein n=1 Tax=Fusarium zealandicum TaxID=1053134 RepID=A0A8H4UIX9_9HYPO|nr:hypothetical protein FZEAL_5838 [Fusarium zealandicum]